MTGKSRRLLALIAFAAASQRAPAAEPPTVRVIEATPAPEWNALFAGKEGWIGGDGAYSCELGAGRVLWLFGDTLFGKVTAGRRSGAMPNNTVGIQSRGDAATPIRFSTGKARDGVVQAVFVPGEAGSWFWPQAAISSHGRVFVFLAQIAKADQPGAFGFKQIGQWLGAIDNPDDVPNKWGVELKRLPFCEFGESGERSWGSALLSDERWVYVYGFEDWRRTIGSKQLTVARAPLDKLVDFSTWQFRSEDGWSDEPQKTAPLAGGLASEFSISRLPGGDGYLLVYTENGLGDRIVGQVAASPQGPWSAPLLLYKCPEMAGDKGVFSYAAKAHPWAARGNDLLVSYCVNTWEFARLFEDNDVYRPQFVRITLAVD